MVSPNGFIYPVAIPMAVDILNIHRGSHLDEIATAVVLAMFGEAKFPGVRAALAARRIIFDELNLSRAEFALRKTLPIGTGYETWFNEHLRVGGRMEGQCAFTLATRYLGIDTLPALRRLQAEILKCDSTDESSETMLASLIKGDNRRKSGITTESFVWAAPAIEAIISYENLLIRGLGKRPVPGEKSLVAQMRRWLSERETAGETVPDRIKHELLRRVHDSTDNKATSVTELAFAVEAMARIGMKDQDIYEWLTYAFVSMYIDQVDFFEQVDKTPDPIEVDAFLDGADRKIYLTVVESDSGNAHRAARYKRNTDQQQIPKDQRIYGITLVGTSTGNKAIFTDRELRDCKVRAGTETLIGIQEVAIRMIEAVELDHMGQLQFRNGQPSPPFFDKLGAPGDGLSGLWHYFKKGEILMNGSPTHPKPPSNISVDDLTEILYYAYHPAKFRQWLDAKFPIDKYPRF